MSNETYEQIVFGFNDYDQDRRDEERHMIADITREFGRGEEY